MIKQYFESLILRNGDITKPFHHKNGTRNPVFFLFFFFFFWFCFAEMSHISSFSKYDTKYAHIFEIIFVFHNYGNYGHKDIRVGRFRISGGGGQGLEYWGAIPAGT